MRTNWIVLSTLAVFLAVTTLALAQEAKPKKAPAAASAAQPTPAQLRATLHRTMAALIEARAAENPDQARINELIASVQALRQQIVAQASAAPVATCPWGGPGLGLGLGRGPGWGPGAGYGRGMGYGGGWGRGPGYGRGAGWGAANGFPGRGFIDQDGDGVCDTYQALHGQE